MSNAALFSWETFEQQVRDCLLNFYDYAFLQNHPLLAALFPNDTSLGRVQQFRQLITDITEELRPEPGIDFHAKAARVYNILLLRYIDAQPVQVVASQLALGERQFYREHARALEALSRVLWQRVQGTLPPEQMTNTADVSFQSEVQWAHTQSKESRLDIPGLLEGVAAATQKLAEQHHVTVRLQLHESYESTIVGTDRTLIRQALILVLSQLMPYTSPGTTIEVAYQVEYQYTTFSISTRIMNGDTLRETLRSRETLHYLLEALHGQISFSPLSLPQFEVSLTVSLNNLTVLLVDDNPGMVELFRRYLANQPYRIVTAQDGERAIQIAQTTKPDIIVLDVMLPGPGRDGWEVLQILKTHPTTQHIPVIVCTVLDVSGLAFSLEATDYLRKPLGQAPLLAALAKCQQ